MANKVLIYSQDTCPYCVRAKSLLKDKGIAYQEINIQREAGRREEMIKRTQRRTVPQIFINNAAIGGYDELAQLNATGKLDQLLGITSNQNLYSEAYDVVIIGAGPAGISAAIYTARKNLSTLIISGDIGGQVGTTNDIENYPGMPGITGPVLVSNFTHHMEPYDIEKLIGEKVSNIEIKQRCKIITTSAGREIHARAVIIATGANKRKLNIPGEKKYAGKGVVYCSTCDGPLFKNMSVAIIGGGNSGLEAAIEMSVICPKVYLIGRGELRGDHILQDKVTAADNIEVITHHEPVRLSGQTSLTNLTVRNLNTGDTKTLDVEGVFVEIGLTPNSGFILDLLDTNERGEIKVNTKGHTGVRGIFAAGDVADGNEKQIVVAAGSGAVAALGVFEYLISQV